MMSWNYLATDEKLNTITHAAGLVLAVIGTPLLVYQSLDSGGILVCIAVGIFCASMIWMYFSSTFYHLTINEDLKKLWKKIDHMSIFALIGGTYTPLISIYYGESTGWSFLIFLWVLILAGMLLKLFKSGGNDLISTLFYLVLGWLVVVVYEPVTSEMPEKVYYWLIIGGLSYSFGVIFYLWKKLKFHHAIWHLFVIVGTLGHFLSIYFSI